MPYLASQRELLLRFRAGDVQALREVYVHYAPDLARFLSTGLLARQAKPLELADATQEVFARAFSERARLGYDGLQPYGAYLAGIARNVVVDQARRVQRTEQSSAPADSVEPVSPELAAEEAEAARLVGAYVDGLAPAARALYQARFVEARSQDDAAVQLGLSRIQLRRAELKVRKGLLEHLKRNGYLLGVRMEGWGVRQQPTAESGRQRGS